MGGRSGLLMCSTGAHAVDYANQLFMTNKLLTLATLTHSKRMPTYTVTSRLIRYIIGNYQTIIIDTTTKLELTLIAYGIASLTRI